MKQKKRLEKIDEVLNIGKIPKSDVFHVIDGRTDEEKAQKLEIRQKELIDKYGPGAMDQVIFIISNICRPGDYEDIALTDSATEKKV